MNTNKKINKISYPEGSSWRKWDLHIHCPDDVLNNQFDGKNNDEKWDKYIEKLESSNIEVMGLTNYFCINGYERIIDFKNKGRLKNIKLILPNIEFRLSEINKDEEFINFHIIFTDNISPIKIKTFLNRVTLLNTDKDGKKLFCTEENLKTIGYDKALIGFDIFDEIIEHFTPLKDYLIIGVIHGYGSFRPSRESKGRKESLAIELDKRSHIIFGNKDNVEFFLNENRYERALKKPVIFSSDAHNLETIGTKFSWIKANPNFEGLKQIIYEPRDRVRIQENDPEPLKSSYSIDSLKISNGNINRNLSIENVEIPLNRNLVAVIGGKGSGKTALLDLIANCYPDKIDSSNKNSFVNRIFNEGQDLFTSISFLNQENFSKKLVESKFIPDSDIEYIPQGQIEDKIGNTREFHNFLQNLIFKSDKVRNSTAYFEYHENEKNKEEIKQKIEELNQDIFTIETQIKNENIENINRQLRLKETEKTNIQEKINSVKRLFTEEKLNEANKLQEELSVFKDRRDKLANLNRLTKSTLEGLTEIENLNKSIEIIKNLTKNLNLKDVTIGLIEYKTIKDQIENIQRKVTLELLTINKSIEQIQNKIERLQKDKKEYIVLLNKIKEIDDAINLLKNKQKNIADLHNSLSEKIEKRWTLYEQLINTYLLLRKKYKEIIEVFSKDAYEILSGIEFKASLIFDFENFAKIGEDILDLRTFRDSKVQKVSLLESEFLKDTFNAIEEITKPESGNSKISNLTAIMKQKVDELLKIKKSTRTNEHLYEWLFGDYLSLNTETYFNETYLEKLSLGQKCTVLLKVYLAQGENTILIDQPDDNLDNEFIMNELVDAIRKAKLNRQVIIASNNANVVVNSDAEQIIVAEYKNGEISYIMGAIEEPIIKEKAIHILEGGRPAFEAREKKYNFK
jgi:energy-coupling factor transporter ATP-binding protein EcfA2